MFVKRQGAPDFLIRSGEVLFPVTQNLEREEHDGLQGMGNGPCNEDHNLHEGRHSQSNPFGVADGIGLGKDLGKDDDQNGHRRGRIDDACFTDHKSKGIGRHGGRSDVEEIVADQDRTDQTFAILHQGAHLGGALVAGELQSVNLRPIRSGQRSFRSGKDG